MATKKGRTRPARPASRTSRPAAAASAARTSSSVDEMLLAALERGGDTFDTGRFLVTFKEGAGAEGLQSLGARGMRVADARDFDGQAAELEAVGDADAVLFPEIGVALVGGEAAQARSMFAGVEEAADSPVESIEPEPFVFALSDYGDYLSGGFARAAEGTPGENLRSAARILEAIAREVYGLREPQVEAEEEVAALGATWGLLACRVPQSTRSGAGIKVAVLDTGMDLGHPDFPAGRVGGAASFVGQPVQDLHGHGTHCIGTACGPKAPAGVTPRYGIGFQSSIFVGKVLSNSGGSVGGSVLNGMNWAIANRCQVISMSLGGPGGPFAFYTAAGQAALNAGCLIIAAAGNGSGAPTSAPANSPTIMSVASLDKNLSPSSFSNRGKIDVAAPGRDIFSSWPRPIRYNTISGTSMATPHVAGCAALWAQTSPNLRGLALRQRLLATARRLPFPATQVGAGLVQAP